MKVQQKTLKIFTVSYTYAHVCQCERSFMIESVRLYVHVYRAATTVQ